MSPVLRDLQFAWRMLWKNPGFTIVAALTLGLGIGANTATFTFVDNIVLRSLEYPDSHELVMLNETSPAIETMSVSYPNFADWRAQNEVFTAVAAFRNQSYNLTGIEHPERSSAR